jgi:hypothetical protein
LNVLSIDIDYAYSPTISKYDQYVEGKRISQKDQDKIFKDNNLPAPKCNQEKLDYLKTIVKKKLKKSAPIVIIENHHEILSFLPKRPIKIFNFDHHHDIFYPGWHSPNHLDEGHWVLFLDKSSIVEYTWIRNFDSEDLEFDVSNVGFSVREIFNFEISKVPEFDIAFFCVSPRWTGKKGKEKVLELVREAR